MKYKEFITPVVLIILGIVLLFVPGEILTTIIMILGAIIVALGVLSILDTIKNKKNNNEIVSGILISILGIVFIANPEVIGGIVPLLIGIFFVLKSATKLQFVILLKKEGTDTWIKPLIVNILTLILGMILIFNPFKGAEALIRIIAGVIILYAILDLIETIMTMPKRVKVIK